MFLAVITSWNKCNLNAFDSPSTKKDQPANAHFYLIKEIHNHFSVSIPQFSVEHDNRLEALLW
jgi:hypothetical protein